MEGLRRATLADMDHILILYRAAGDAGRQNSSSDWDETYPTRELAEHDIQCGALYVCEEEGSIVAAFSLLPTDDVDEAPLPWTPGHSCVLCRLCVEPTLQRRGMGRRMVRLFAREARSLGYEWVHLMTPATNLAANAMYQRLKLREMGHFLAYGIDFICYEAPLEALCAGVSSTAQ